jgi:hypothetical protein
LARHALAEAAGSGVALVFGLCESAAQKHFPATIVANHSNMRGSKPGERRGGRRRGTKNKASVAVEQARAEAAARITKALGADAFEGDAHALLVSIYKDPSRPISVRVDAAKAAIGYEKPRLAAVAFQTEPSSVVIQVITGVSRSPNDPPISGD